MFRLRKLPLVSLGEGSHLYEGSGWAGGLSAPLQLRRALAPLNGSPETDQRDDGGEAWLLSLSDTGTN